MDIFNNLTVGRPWVVNNTRKLTEEEKVAVKSCTFCCRMLGDAEATVAEFVLNNGKISRIVADIEPCEPYYTQISESVYHVNEVPLDINNLILVTLDKDDQTIYRIKLG